ncbi:MAG: DUF86 domain-containing protein [Rhodospirillaceae bacterium]|nr:DUF86 domain-containing protein [Rhodospirillaceae bacterium]
MRHEDALLLDMLLAAREAQEIAREATMSDFRQNRTLQLAILKAVEIVGEAASRISAETRELNPDIPWADIVGMRNRLVHGYFDVNLTRVWETVERDIPRLIGQLEGLVSEEQP